MRSIFLSFLIFAMVNPPAPAMASEISVAQVEKIVDAIYIIEGGAKARKPFGILSVPCKDFDDCRRVCKNTVQNNYKRWTKAGRPGDYLAFLAARYAPVQCHPLNKNWLPNLRKELGRK